MRRVVRLVGAALICTVAAAVACSKEPQSPASPTAATPANGDANADGSTLKATAPSAQSPSNGQRFTNTETNATVTLVVANSTMPYATNTPLTYRFEGYNSAGVRIYQSALVPAGSSGTTSNTVALNLENLEGDQLYSWQARAEYQGQAGPWSPRLSFVEVPPELTGFIRTTGVYDPLIKGVTVGRINGPVTFIPNVGVRLNDPGSWIEYNLPATLRSGEFSLLATNLQVVSRNEDPKWRVMTMREGDAAINDNEYRMSVDKRGNGAIAWRFLTGPGDYIETTSSERIPFAFHENLTYFIRASWGSNTFRVQFREGGFDGATFYDSSRGYSREYSPLPHNAFIGSPYAAGDRGEVSSVDGMIVRQVWISPLPRPTFINK